MAADPLTASTVDGLLNLDNFDYDDPFNDRPTQQDGVEGLSSSPGFKRKADDLLDASLGLDEEVKVTKKRKPISKLDEARLLSAPGIPKLRADARSGKFSKKLRLKGKGHEFSDVARLLNYYQLWLDNLYPRAKFADGLQLIEKVGHSRRMQIMRKEWIDEGKPGYIRDREANKIADREKEADKEADDLFVGVQPAADNVGPEAANADVGPEDDSLFVPDLHNNADNGEDDGILPDDDELDALLAEQETRITTRPVAVSKPTEDDDSEGDDDLDALLAEQEMRRAPPPPPTSQHTSTFAPKLKPSPFGGDDSDEDEEMDDLDALLAEQEARMQPSTAQSKLSSIQASSTQNKDRPSSAADQELTQDDELDVLIAEQEARGHVAREAPTSSAPAVRPATPPAAAVADGADGADGADMFSSSPVRGTAPIGLGLSGQLELERDPASPRSTVTTTTGRTYEAGASESEDAQRSRPGDDSIEETAEEKQESQGLDAGDMFSSSPVQNE
ncbi:hypothetical protein AYL99_05548 [Fonsecaea erecta]|uniref:Chromosome segregation in meiosis protein n=1 Tax=Fonsecaea erecta TaxID=1367422 RepID=A0A178ZMD8_9EURO|nr:hypothetical protein AYL99_05548 [Fonsecaea erecta]OAP60546.1 hypothetical protein AYL99_05548 [Fonsecaea erecta]